MANILDSLNLNKVLYKTSTDIKFDKSINEWVATLNNPDLALVLTNSDKTKLEAEVKKVVEMHCYIESMEYIDRCLFYNSTKSSVKSEKVACNILVSSY